MQVAAGSRRWVAALLAGLCVSCAAPWEVYDGLPREMDDFERVGGPVTRPAPVPDGSPLVDLATAMAWVDHLSDIRSPMSDERASRIAAHATRWIDPLRERLEGHSWRRCRRSRFSARLLEVCRHTLGILKAARSAVFALERASDDPSHLDRVLAELPIRHHRSPSCEDSEAAEIVSAVIQHDLLFASGARIQLEENWCLSFRGLGPLRVGTPEAPLVAPFSEFTAPEVRPTSEAGEPTMQLMWIAYGGPLHAIAYSAELRRVGGRWRVMHTRMLGQS